MKYSLSTVLDGNQHRPTWKAPRDGETLSRPFGLPPEGDRSLRMTRPELILIFQTLTTRTQGGPDPELIAPTMTGWLDMFKDTPTAAVQAAVEAHLRDTRVSSPTDDRPRGRWWPMPTDILQRIESADDPRRIGEWDRILRALSRGESLGEITPPIEAGIKAAGGTFAIKTRLEKDTATLRAAFVEAHRKAEATHPLITVTTKDNDHA